MNQSDLDRAVARATGETVTEIRKLGFNLVVVPDSPSHAPLPHVIPFKRPRTNGSPPIKRAA